VHSERTRAALIDFDWQMCVRDLSSGTSSRCAGCGASDDFLRQQERERGGGGAVGVGGGKRKIEEWRARGSPAHGFERAVIYRADRSSSRSLIYKEWIIL
jgi:hypothetical protein